MPYFALDTILLGGLQIEAGSQIPDSYTDPWGDEQEVDHDRLVEIGAAEKASKPSITPTVEGTEPADGSSEGAGDLPTTPQLSYQELKAELKQRGLPTTGKTEELAERLAAAVAEGKDPDQGS